MKDKTRLLQLIARSIHKNDIIKDKYVLDVDFKNDAISAYKLSEKKKYSYKVITKDAHHLNCVLVNKKDFEKFDYFIILDSILDFSNYGLHNVECKIFFNETMKVNFNNGIFDSFANDCLVITDEFIKNCEESTSILI